MNEEKPKLPSIWRDEEGNWIGEEHRPKLVSKFHKCQHYWIWEKPDRYKDENCKAAICRNCSLIRLLNRKKGKLKNGLIV